MSLRVARAGHVDGNIHLYGCFGSEPPPSSVLVRLPFRAGEAKLAIGYDLDASRPPTPVPIGVGDDAPQVACVANKNAPRELANASTPT